MQGRKSTAQRWLRAIYFASLALVLFPVNNSLCRRNLFGFQCTADLFRAFSFHRQIEDVFHYRTGIFVYEPVVFILRVSGQNASDLMQILFWMEEDNPGMLKMFQFKRIPGECVNISDDPGVYYHDNDHWPAHEPYGFWLDYPLLNDFVQEWLFHREELKADIITKEEYFEWKINWPYTCDDCNRRIPSKDWRKSKTDNPEDMTNE